MHVKRTSYLNSSQHNYNLNHNPYIPTYQFKMLFRNSLILLALGCAEAFAPSPSFSSQPISTQQMTQSVLRPSTMLYAEEAEEAAEEAPAAASGAADDILNSPAFLKRKIDVLKSDIAAIDEKISAANEVYEAGKAEWGPQIENLRKEVRSMLLSNFNLELNAHVLSCHFNFNFQLTHIFIICK